MLVLTQNVSGTIQATTEKVGHFSASRPNSRGQRNPQPVATKDATLTDLIFTPADDTLFNDFSFRGQIERAGFTGDIDVMVTDSSGAVSTIDFTGVKGPDADFDRLGVVSTDGETIKSVEVLTPGSESFKEFKQVEFSFVVPPPPIPEPASVALLGVGLVTLSLVRRRKG